MDSAFADVKPSRFPFTVYAFRASSLLDVEPVWKATVTGPGALAVPALHDLVGEPVRIVVHYADGSIERDEPPT